VLRYLLVFVDIIGLLLIINLLSALHHCSSSYAANIFRADIGSVGK